MEKKKSDIDKIRKDKSEGSENRRSVAALAAAGLVDFSLISLLQLGYFSRLPDLPGKIFNTKKVDTSQDAVILGMPDGVISLGAYVATMKLLPLTVGFKQGSFL